MCARWRRAEAGCESTPRTALSGRRGHQNSARVARRTSRLVEATNGRNGSERSRSVSVLVVLLSLSLLLDRWRLLTRCCAPLAKQRVSEAFLKRIDTNADHFVVHHCAEEHSPTEIRRRLVCGRACSSRLGETTNQPLCSLLSILLLGSIGCQSTIETPSFGSSCCIDDFSVGCVAHSIAWTKHCSLLVSREERIRGRRTTTTKKTDYKANTIPTPTRVAYRAWSHYRAYVGAVRLREALAHEADELDGQAIIRFRASKALAFNADEDAVRERLLCDFPVLSAAEVALAQLQAHNSASQSR